MSPRGRLRDPRLWVGLGITALALWLSFRDVSWRQLGHDVARANWWLLVWIALPAHLWALQLRAQRWCVLARGVADFGQGPSLRATAVGFMVNNLLPLRSALLTDNALLKLQEALARAVGPEARLRIEVGAADGESPAQAAEREAAARLAATRDTLEHDPVVQALASEFGAKLDPSSVRPRDD